MPRKKTSGQLKGKERGKEKREPMIRSDMIHLGDMVSVETSWSGTRKLSGRVVYINPNKRWFTLEFTSVTLWGSRTVRESCCMIPVEYLSSVRMEDLNSAQEEPSEENGGSEAA